MSSATEAKLRWPDILYAYLRYGWGEWSAILTVSAASIVWCVWNFVLLARSGSVFVLGGRYGGPNHWATFTAEPLAVVAWTAIDLMWLLASMLAFSVSALWVQRRVSGHLSSR